MSNLPILGEDIFSSDSNKLVNGYSIWSFVEWHEMGAPEEETLASMTECGSRWLVGVGEKYNI